MHEGFLEFALLLQDTGQVRVSCSKLWEHLNNKVGYTEKQLSYCVRIDIKSVPDN